MLKFSRTVSVFVLVCSVLLSGISAAAFVPPQTAQAAANAAPCEIKWQDVSVPNIGALHGVTALSENDIWALGSNQFLHWNGIRWSPVPTLDSADFARLGALPLTQLVAIGTAYEPGNDQPAAAWRWSGTDWRPMAGSRAGQGAAEYQGIKIITPSNMWAVGFDYMDMSFPLLAHWVENQWKQVAPPAIAAPASLQVIDAVSGQDIWAAGTHGESPRQLWLIHRGANGWSTFAAPPPPSPTANIDPNAIVTIAPNDVWVFGEQDPDRTAMAVHWNGTIWQNVNTGMKVNHPLLGAAAAAPDNLWVVGDRRVDENKPILAHWNGRTWTQALAYHKKHIIPNAYLTGVVSMNSSLWWAVGARGNGRSFILKGTCAS